MAKIGYARVSTKAQNDDSQVDELTAHGCDKLFIDHGVIIDFRVPDGVRIGLSPLTTSFEELWLAMDRMRELAASAT